MTRYVIGENICHQEYDWFNTKCLEDSLFCYDLASELTNQKAFFLKQSKLKKNPNNFTGYLV